MKKIYSILTLSFFILMSISIFSCDKDKDTEPDVNQCVVLGEAYVEALTAYINDPTSEKSEVKLSICLAEANAFMEVTREERNSIFAEYLGVPSDNEK